MSGLLSKSLHSSTFRVALLCILIFGAVVLALFSYVYLATDAYVLAQSDRAIDADRDYWLARTRVESLLAGSWADWMGEVNP